MTETSEGGSVPMDTPALTTSDDLTLEADLVVPDQPVASAVICHPHPLYGGNMHNNVVDALFSRWSTNGVACLRFNFRGVGQSGGSHGEGTGERLDIVAAIELLADQVPGVPVILAGYSFGADVSLSVADDRISAWFAVAPPLRVIPTEQMVAATDPRPKSIITGSNDDFRPPDQLRDAVADWTNCRVAVADGAGHFFSVGLPDVADAALALSAELTS